jgi:hypothetical protein
MADISEALATFVAVTGADQDAALSMLEATNWDAQEAVNLFFATQAAGGGAAPSATAGGGGDGYQPPADVLAAAGEDDVRAPLPARVAKLYDDAGPMYSQMQRAARASARPPQVGGSRSTLLKLCGWWIQ